MVQRWNSQLSTYGPTIGHRTIKSIPYADFLSRYSYFESLPHESDYILVQLLPADIEGLVKGTCNYIETIISTLKRGWNIQCKRRLPKFCKIREHMLLHYKGFFVPNYRKVTPFILRSTVLDGHQFAHLEAEKMKSLVHQTSWWPDIDSDARQNLINFPACLHKLP